MTRRDRIFATAETFTMPSGTVPPPAIADCWERVRNSQSVNFEYDVRNSVARLVPDASGTMLPYYTGQSATVTGLTRHNVLAVGGVIPPGRWSWNGAEI